MNKKFSNFVGLVIAIAIVCTLAALFVTPAGGSAPTPAPAFSLVSYDTNGDGIISKDEALKAVRDYFDWLITKDQVLEVVVAYFNSTPIPTPTPSPTPTPTPAPPQADFVGNPTVCNGPTTVNFTDRSTGEITSWSWDFGDGHTSSLQNPTNYYSHNGYYTISLIVAGLWGADTETKPSYIYVYGCPT
jgi:PKD repeat protein